MNDYMDSKNNNSGSNQNLGNLFGDYKPANHKKSYSVVMNPS